MAMNKIREYQLTKENRSNIWRKSKILIKQLVLLDYELIALYLF